MKDGSARDLRSCQTEAAWKGIAIPHRASSLEPLQKAWASRLRRFVRTLPACCTDLYLSRTSATSQEFSRHSRSAYEMLPLFQRVQEFDHAPRRSSKRRRCRRIPNIFELKCARFGVRTASQLSGGFDGRPDSTDCAPHGVVGFSDVILRLIATLDSELACALSAEDEFRARSAH